MSQVSEFFKHTIGSALGRAVTVPEKDMPDVLAAINDSRQSEAYQLTESDVRAVERVQAVYVAGRIVHQVLPPQLQPLAGVVIDAVAPPDLPPVPGVPTQAAA